MDVDLERIINAETGMLDSMANLFADYQKTFVTQPGVTPAQSYPDYVDALKQILCALACKELSIANIIEAVACKIAVNNGSIQSEVCCKCCC